MIVLTPQEEEQLLADYSRVAWKLVHRFSDGRHSSVFSQEDLYQECMLVLIKHMQKCETKEDLRHFHVMEMINAMTRFVLKGQAVRLDPNRTNKVKQTLQSLKGTVSISDVAGLQDLTSEDDWIAMIDFGRYLDTLTPCEKDFVLLTKCGYRQVETSQKLGKSRQWGWYMKDSTKRKYDAYFAS